MKLIFASGLVVLAITSALGARHEAPAGFDPRGNGMVDEATHQADQNSFDEVETSSRLNALSAIARRSLSFFSS